MRHIVKSLLVRHEPRQASWSHIVQSGIGGFLGIGAAGALATFSGFPLLVAPLGASAVIIFGHPQSHFSQPINVLGGYLVASLIAMAAMLLLPSAWWVAAIGVGLAIVVMMALRVTHPPAGAVPILAMSYPFGAPALLGTVAGGAVILVLVATIHHAWPMQRDYPKRLPRN